ncbi:cysteine desulfurase [Bacillus sp. FJAT-27916]|uniref:cysteine desulfurase family protein n=1 Tax=Bacillus sp. FJAT-27916 TaxID=1679169 RepID=UPI0006708F30|nr:cysteine desulfurase family protein [Bacillus sp. FJAT-27916]KMY43662.1 cysteine desulfurase [Bacillus sp. FJAT-27916]
METIYLDHAATTPMHPEAIRVMTDVMNDTFGNPSSIHQFGRAARKRMDDSRKVLADSIRASIDEIIFTSGGTEADNSAIFSAVQALRDKGNHIITSEIEHHAVLHTCEELEKHGFDVTYLPVDELGRVSVDSVKQALRDDTILVTIMYGNNEVGTLQPIREIGRLLKDHQAFFHTDAVQAYGAVPIDVKELGVDFMSVSSHKINGPKGIGFLYARKGIPFKPLLFGGEQERKRRAGTENVAGAAGFAKAAEIIQQTAAEKTAMYKTFKGIMIRLLEESGIEFAINGTLDESLPHILNISFPGVSVEAFLVNLDLAGIAVSSGSACTAGSIEPSHVLVAMFGKESERTKNSIRFSFGLNNTTEEIERAALTAIKVANRLAR